MSNAFAVGMVELSQMQHALGQPPKRSNVPKLVNELVKKAGLGGDPRERYFRLLATCALRNQEPRFCNWKARKQWTTKKSGC